MLVVILVACRPSPGARPLGPQNDNNHTTNHDNDNNTNSSSNTTEANDKYIVAIFYRSSQFCEIYISLLSPQTQPNTAPNLFQRGVEYGEYEEEVRRPAK